MPNEDDYRLTALQTSYGTGTRSYNRSAQKREMDNQRERITQEFEACKKRPVYTVGPVCTCRSFPRPHFIVRHRELRSQMDWRIRIETQDGSRPVAPLSTGK